MALQVDHLSVLITAETAEYKKSISDAVAHTKSGTEAIQDHAAKMGESVTTGTEKIAKALETNVSQASMKAAASFKQSADSIVADHKRIGDAAKMAEAKKIYGQADPLAGLGKQFAAADAGLGKLAQSSAELEVLKKTAGAGSKVITAIGGVSSALKVATPFIGMWSADAGLAAAGVTQLAEVCPPAAGALAVFGGAIVGTTYLLHGQEAAQHSLGDAMEGGKYLLKGLTGGYLDLTEAGTATKKSEEALQAQMVSGTAMVAQYKQKRQDLIATLQEQVAAQHDLSAAGEAKFASSYRGELSHTGSTVRQLDSEERRAHGLYENRRVEDELFRLKEKADAMGRTEEMQVKETLASNHATAAQREQAQALLTLIATKKAAEQATKDSAKAEEEATRTAKHAADEAKRQTQHVADEGKRLAESLRTPQEKLADELKHVDDLQKAGAISAETHARAVAKLNEEKPEKEITQHAAHTGPLGKDSEQEALVGYLQSRQIAYATMLGARRAGRNVTPSAASVAGDIPTPGRTIKYKAGLGLKPYQQSQAQLAIAASEAEPSLITKYMAASYRGASASPTLQENDELLKKNNELLSSNTEALKENSKADTLQLVAADL